MTKKLPKPEELGHLGQIAYQLMKIAESYGDAEATFRYNRRYLHFGELLRDGKYER